MQTSQAANKCFAFFRIDSYQFRKHHGRGPSFFVVMAFHVLKVYALHNPVRPVRDSNSTIQPDLTSQKTLYSNGRIQYT